MQCEKLLRFVIMHVVKQKITDAEMVLNRFLIQFLYKTGTKNNPVIAAKLGKALLKLETPFFQSFHGC